jgi:hypothetical protein
MHCTHLSAVSSRLLQWGRFQFSKAAGTDALATRLARRFLGRQARRFLWGLRRCLERCVGHEAVGNVLLAVCLRHGKVAVVLCGGGVRDGALM